MTMNTMTMKIVACSITINVRKKYPIVMYLQYKMSSSNILTIINEIDDVRIKEMCEIVSRQTDYSLDEIKDKLIEYNYQYIDVIKEYMGIEKEKPYVIASINQEIYKQIRHRLDAATKDYNSTQYDKLWKELADDADDVKESPPPPLVN